MDMSGKHGIQLVLQQVPLLMEKLHLNNKKEEIYMKEYKDYFTGFILNRNKGSNS